MVREFSEEKKEELYRILTTLDDSPCGSFLEWCGSRRYEFGDWMDRLSIPSYMGKIDQFETRITDMNASIRSQIDTVFSNVYAIDRKYGEIFQNYAEIVKGQKQLVDDMREMLRSGNDSREKEGTEESTEDKYPFVITDEKLDRYIEQLEKKKLTPEEEILDRYLQVSGYTNSVERQFVIDMIREKQPGMLNNLYVTGRYSTATQETIAKQIIIFYETNKKDIELDTIVNQLRNDENAKKGIVVCEYLEFLQELQYICQADYDILAVDIEDDTCITGETMDEIYALLSKRGDIIDELSNSKMMENNVEDERWTREQIMCALQIEAELKAIGCDKEFIAGFIGNMKNEGRFGLFEKVNESGKLNGECKDYWIHMIQCVDYYNVYNGKELENIDLIQVYYDLLYKKENGECTDATVHKIGVGAIQWTDPVRSEKLMEFYLKQAGYDMNSPQFNEFIQDWKNDKSHEAVYLTEEQIRNAEINMMIYELTSEDEDNYFRNFYENYSKERSDNDQEALRKATYIIMNDYERPSEDSFDKRFATAERWYDLSTE